ncbi:MAG: sensor histidine kinase, partial [Chitinophagaceae bacterium]
VAALIWWFIALQNQNKLMANMRLVELNKDDPRYLQKVAIIEDAKRRKTAQYVGEGCTFLALIIVGAVFVFRVTRKQIRLSQQQQNFMMAITHELKTPIAITKLNLETLQKRKLEEQQQKKLIGNSLHENNRLNILCNNILMASQLDAGVIANKQEINFTSLINSSIHEFKVGFPQRVFHSHITENIYLLGEEMMLQMLANNLIENAVKYSPKESVVTIELIQKNNKIQLIVIDEGVGIEESEKKLIFDKFYRSGNENTRKTKGTGLGLYLCNRIMNNHKGTIVVTNNIPRGSIFTATF